MRIALDMLVTFHLGKESLARLSGIPFELRRFAEVIETANGKFTLNNECLIGVHLRGSFIKRFARFYFLACNMRDIRCSCRYTVPWKAEEWFRIQSFAARKLRLFITRLTLRRLLNQ